MASSKDDVTRQRTITIKVGEFIFVKDGENNQITSVCLSVQKTELLFSLSLLERVGCEINLLLNPLVSRVAAPAAAAAAAAATATNF